MRAIGIVLAGGNSKRMRELSNKRAIAAMPIAGSYRSVDFALSNMSNSHIQSVAVLTQYNSRSLNEHLSSSKWWDFGRKQGGMYVFTPTITAESSDWYRGTADALYQNLDFLKKSHEPYVVIAGGDCVYKLDYGKVLEYHIEKKADITVVCKEMPPEEDVTRFGLVKLNDDGRITDFEEKPMLATSSMISCGIYVIRRRQLIELLERCAAEDRYDFVILSIRLPRILMGILVGAGLSVSGAIYQAVFGNPLVSPDILGVSSGAGFGAALAILLSCGMAATQVIALGCGLLAVVIVLNLSRIKRRSELFVLVLSGVIVKSMFDALVSFIKYIADPEDKLPTITMWLMGSLANVSYRDVLLCAAIEIPCLAVAMILRWKMNLLSLDQEEARSLGINVKKLRLAVILIATIMTAVTVSVCGIIGWIGLVIPHIARLLIGNDHRTLIPASVLMGSIYLLLIDTAARAATAGEVPLSILTAMVGAPFFAVILRKTSGGRE